MSDTNDWTGVTAAATAVVAQGAAATVAHRLVVNIPSITATTRSLLFLLTNAAGSPGPATLAQAIVQGGVSGIRWISATNLVSDVGTLTTPVGDGWAPIYVPLYGLVDTSATATFTFDADYNIDYWVLELPDADLLGSPLLPVMVGSPPYPALEAAQQARTFVGVPTGDTFPVKSTPTDPTPHTAHTAHPASANNATVALLAAPAAGTLWEVVRLEVLSGTAATNPANFLAVKGVTSGAFYLIGYENAAGTENHTDAVMYISEALNFQAAGISGQAVAVARPVTQV